MSTPHQKVTCCECSVRIGSSGPARATLLLPCYHVMHLRCVEYLQRLCALKNHTRFAHSFLTAELAETVPKFSCPGCQRRVQKAIPLYLGDSDPSSAPTAKNTDAEGWSGGVEMELVFEAQRQHYELLQGLVREKQRLTSLTHSCAGLHHQQVELQHELDQHLSVLPSISSTAAASRMEVDTSRYSGQELQSYISHIAPVVDSAQRDLRRLRREKAVKQRRVEKLKSTCRRAQKKLQSLRLANTTEGQKGVRLLSSSRHAGPTVSSAPFIGSSDVGVPGEPSACCLSSPRLSGASSSSGCRAEEPPSASLSPLREMPQGSEGHDTLSPPHESRRRSPVKRVVDVDEQRREEATPEDIIILVSSSESEVEELPFRGAIDIDDSSDSVSVRDETADQGSAFSSDGGGEREGRSSSRDALSPRLQTLTPSSSRLSRSRPGTPRSGPATEAAAAARVTVHHVRSLPRREDYLWQRTLLS